MSEVNSNTYTIMNNPLLQDTDVISAAAGVIQDVLDTMDSYVPVEVNTFADWAYDAGDIVTIVKDGVDYVMPIFQNALNWNGGSDVTWQSSGNPEREIPDAPQRQSYGYGTAITQVETDLTETQKSFHTYMEQTDTYISLIADETDIETAQLLSSTLFKITSASITGLVEKVGAVPTGENLYSLYQQDAGMIALVVGTGSGGNYIKAASIVTAINDQDGSGQVMIDAGQITLNGTTTIKGDVTIDGTTYTGLKVSAIETSGVIAGDLDVTHKFTMDDGTTCIFYNTPTFDGGATVYEGLTFSGGSSDYTLTAANVPNMVMNASVASNVLTLTKLDGTTVNFSKATSVSGGWSSGTYTANATQTNYNTTTRQYETTNVGSCSTSPTIQRGSWSSGVMTVSLVEGSGGATVSTGVTQTVSIPNVDTDPTDPDDDGYSYTYISGANKYSISYSIGGKSFTYSNIDAQDAYDAGAASGTSIDDISVTSVGVRAAKVTASANIFTVPISVTISDGTETRSISTSVNVKVMLPGAEYDADDHSYNIYVVGPSDSYDTYNNDYWNLVMSTAYYDGKSDGYTEGYSEAGFVLTTVSSSGPSVVDREDTVKVGYAKYYTFEKTSNGRSSYLLRVAGTT